MKQREKLVRKIIPVEIYDMAGLEHWLSDMAAQGLHLVKLSSETARFRRGEPAPGTRFGLDIAGLFDIDHARNEAYAEAGWTYVTTLPDIYYVYRTDRADAPPLHTDPVTQSETLTPLIRRTRRTRIFAAAYLLFCFRNTLVTVVTQPWMLGQYVVLKTGLFLALMVMLAGWAILSPLTQTNTLKRLKKMKRQLADGIPLKEGRRDRASRVVLSWCAAALLLSLPFLVIFCGSQSAHKLSGPEEWTFPHVTLERAFHGEADITLDTPQMMTRYNTRTASLLCPEQYDWVQRGDIHLSGNTGEATLSVDFYRTRTDWAAEWLFSSLWEEEAHYPERFRKKQEQFIHPTVLMVHQPLRAVTCPGLDSLEYTILQYDDDPPNYIYLGRQDNQVFRLLCRGVPDQAECLELFLAQLDPLKASKGGALL